MSSPRYWRLILEPETGVWEICRDKEIIAIGYPDYPDDSNVLKFKNEMKTGDKVVAYLKNWRIGAIGTVVGEYSVDEVMLRVIWRGHYWRTRKVKWDHKSFGGWEFPREFSKDVKKILSQRGATIVELDKSHYEEIENQVLSL